MIEPFEGAELLILWVTIAIFFYNSISSDSETTNI